MMYHNYFGLEEPAFSIAVNPRYLYMSQQHKEALAHLLYGVQGGGFVLLSGEVGTGKTTIIRSLLEQLPENTEIAIVLNPMAEAQEILSTVCDELGIEYDKTRESIKVLTDALQERLLENHRQGRNTVLLIDEAQLLSAEVLEQIRLLTNLETNTEKLLQIVLVGQPELNALLAQPRLRQLSQRITARFHLKPLNIEETWAYINHRLQVAGMPEDRNPFTPRIIKRVHAFTGGIPRKINILCERILIGAYGHNQSRVDNKVFQLAKREVTGHNPEENTIAHRSNLMLISAVVATALLVAAASFFIFGSGSGETIAPVVDLNETSSEVQTTPVAPLVNDIAPPATSDNRDPFFDNSSSAQRSLFAWLEMEVNDEDYPCWQLAEKNIECRRSNLENWSDLIEINRPAVLTLTSEDKFLRYALITGINSEKANLINTANQAFSVDLKNLGPMWTGEIFYIWQRPPGFKDPLTRGQRNETIRWLAEQFASIDGQESPLTNSYFNEKLEQRVKIFQRDNQLSDDGIVGQQTLMKLNEALGIDVTLAQIEEH